MNILVISHEFPPIGGGGANACKFLTKEYVRLGNAVTVVTARYGDTPNYEEVDGVKIFRLTVKREKVDTSTFSEMLSYLKTAYLFTDRLCKKENFDACHVFFGIPSGPIALHLKRKYKLPYVVRFGGGDIPGAQKRFKYVYKMLNPIIRSIWKNAKYLVANSQVLRDKALAYENKYPINIISNGVDSDYFKRSLPYEVKDDIRILFVSRIIEGKGLQYVIPRLKEINDKVGKKVVLTIVGDGPYRKNLEELVDDENRGFVRFLGRKEGTDLLDCYNQANLFILPSLSEGMPNVVLEAMSMELPIVMTDCGGSKELVSGNGIVSPINEFVGSLIDVCKDPKQMIKYSKNSGERARELFSWNTKAKENLKLLNG